MGRSRSPRRSARRSRSRSRSRRGAHSGSRDAKRPPRREGDISLPAASAAAVASVAVVVPTAPAPEPPAVAIELDDTKCVRLGVPSSRAEITREQVMAEVDSVRLANKVAKVVIEERVPDAPYLWARIYFQTSEDADQCVKEFNIPGRQTKWRTVVSQRLPLVGPFSGDVGGDPTFEPCVEDPADSLVVDTQEGYVYFMTDEMYRTKGLEDYFQAKRLGKMIRRLICKHFDPQKRQPCRFGPQCTFLHIKAASMNRLLRTVSHHQPLRVPKNEEDIQISSWEFDRRQDTLVVRDLEPGLDLNGLRYMFEACVGFAECFLRQRDDKLYGIVRFDSQQSAMNALLQTFDSGLNISFAGTLEDIRMMQLHEAKRNPHYERDQRQKFLSRQEDKAKERGPTATPTESVPFPPLPEGWVYGLSRRTQQYYFYQVNSKERTTWKHPTTNESYAAPLASPA